MLSIVWVILKLKLTSVQTAPPPPPPKNSITKLTGKTHFSTDHPSKSSKTQHSNNYHRKSHLMKKNRTRLQHLTFQAAHPVTRWRFLQQCVWFADMRWRGDRKSAPPPFSIKPLGSARFFLFLLPGKGQHRRPWKPRNTGKIQLPFSDGECEKI